MSVARLDRAPARPPAARVAPAAVPRRNRWLPRLLAPAAVLVVFGVHLALAWPVRVPIIHPDELGYLTNARVLARGGLRSPVEYYPGFSVLLVPLWLGTASSVRVFRETLGVQAGLSAALAVLVWVLSARLVPAVGGWRRVLLVGAVCAYPSYLLYSDLALSEVAFAAGFVAVVLLFGGASRDRRPLPWLALGLCSGLLAAVHPRGLAVVVAVAVLGVVVLGLRLAALPALTALVAGTVGGLAAVKWLLVSVQAPATVLGAYQPSNVLSRSLSAHGVWSLAVELAGQLFYLSVATLGLVPLGLALGGVAAWRVTRGARDTATVLRCFGALSFVGVWALSSLFMNLGNRADKLIYGRYNEGVIAPLLLVAAGWLLAGPRPGRWWRWVVAGAGAAAASGALVFGGDSQRALFGSVNPINVLGLQPVLTRMGEHIHVVALVGLGAGAICVLALVAWRWPAVAVAAVILVFCASALDTETSYVVPGSRARAHEDAIAAAILSIRAAGIGPDQCVSYDPAPLGYADYNFFEDQFLAPGQRFAPYSSGPPCGTLVVSRSPSFAGEHPGAREVTAENGTGQVLWAVPGGPMYDALAARGWLAPLPAGTAASPLPQAARAGGSLRLEPGPVVRLRPATSARIAVVVTHGPGGAPWPAVAALHTGSGEYGVRMTVQSDGPMSLVTGGIPTACVAAVSFTACQRVELPQTLLPGQAVTLPLTVNAGLPGTYTVELGLVQEGVGAFAPTARLTVIVTDG